MLVKKRHFVPLTSPEILTYIPRGSWIFAPLMVVLDFCRHVVSWNDGHYLLIKFEKSAIIIYMYIKIVIELRE